MLKEKVEIEETLHISDFVAIFISLKTGSTLT